MLAIQSVERRTGDQYFLNQGLTASTTNDTSAIISLYERYRDKQEDAVLADGAAKLLNGVICRSYRSVIMQALGACAKSFTSILTL